MLLGVYAVYDKKAAVYAQPFFQAHELVALRSFVGACKGFENSDLSRFPEDFALYQLGTFNDESGLLSHLEMPRFLMAGDTAKAEALK